MQCGCRITPTLLQLSRSVSTRLTNGRAAGRIVGRDIEGAGTLARRRVSHPPEVVTGFTRRKPRHARQKVFFARGFRNALPLSHRGSAATWHKSQRSALRPWEPQLNKSCRPRLGRLESERHQPSCGGVADSAAERDPWRRSTPGARPAPDHPAVACAHPRWDTTERDHGKAAGGATEARD